MYVKPETRKRITRPDKYGGNAFNQSEAKDVTESAAEPVAVEMPSDAERKEEKRDFLPLGIGSEELLLLAILLVLTQSDEGGDILPFLLILLFFKGGK